MIKLLRVLVCASVVITLGACASSGVNGSDSISGYWIVTKAYRDKVETRLLADVFFLFNGDGTMRSNLPYSGNGPAAYTISGDQLVQQGNSPVIYDIIRHTDSTLVLGFDTNNTRFELHLVLTEQPGILNIEEEEVDTMR
ncbi:MAG: hypothetical protein ACKOCO_16200 [Bacteroidota bacterium]